MTVKTHTATPPVNPSTLIKRILLGAGIGLVLICLFVFNVKDPNPEWGRLWRIRPLMVVPFAGAFGAALFYFIAEHRRFHASWQKALAIIVGLLVFIFGLWVGIVLGLDGTLWD